MRSWWKVETPEKSNSEIKAQRARSFYCSINCGKWKTRCSVAINSCETLLHMILSSRVTHA